MHNLLILYNPYHQKDVIEKHIEIHQNHPNQSEARVAFGKIHSKLRDCEHPFEGKLREVYDSATDENYIQLFLTDYSSMYVARVVEVISDDCYDMAPSYCKNKDLDIGS